VGSSDGEAHYLRIAMLTEHLVSGTCQIQLMVSGKRAQDIPWVKLSGVEVRHMAGWVMDQCVSVTTEDKRGGYITKDLANTIDYLTRPDISYEDPFRKLPPCPRDACILFSLKLNST